MTNIRSWLAAHDYIKQARVKHEGRPLGRETRLVISRGSPCRYEASEASVYAVRYHSSEVVRFYPGGNVGIDLNGWSSKTTKVRVRDHTLGSSIWSSCGELMLTWRGALEGADHVFVIPIDQDMEYILTPRRSVIMPNGFEMSGRTARVAQPRSETFPLKRVSDPPRGGVVVSPKGVPYLVDKSRSTGNAILMEYLGDFADARTWAFLGNKTIEMTNLFCMTMADWSPGKRFVRSFDS